MSNKKKKKTIPNILLFEWFCGSYIDLIFCNINLIGNLYVLCSL